MAVCLALNGASRLSGVWVVRDGTVVSGKSAEAERGQAQWLASATDRVLRQANVSVPVLGLIAVTIGPGSFTGIRAALALAQGLALGSGRPVVGVTVGEALAEEVEYASERVLWVASDSRRGRVFLERHGRVEAYELDALPTPEGLVAIAGEQAIAVTAALAARDVNVQLAGSHSPSALGIERGARKRLLRELPPRSAQPLYVDPPEARIPAGGHRPAPVG